MRSLIIPLLFLFVSCKDEKVTLHKDTVEQRNPVKPGKFVKAQTIASKADSLNTNEDVAEYLKVIDSNFSGLTIEQKPYLDALKNPDINPTAKAKIRTLNIDKSFFKADFDNNGYTDLLVIGGWDVTSSAYEGKRLGYASYVIMNFGKDSLQIHSMEKDLTSLTVPEIRYKGLEPYIVMHPLNSKNGKEIYLTGKFGVFAEYNADPEDNGIEKIEFEAGPCFGTCPMFKMTINKDRSAVFLAEHYNFDKNREIDFNKNEGLFKTTLKIEDYTQIIDLLNYIDFKGLKDQYAVSYTDAPSADLKITYKNGKIKKIDDYGMCGTYGLQAVYQFFRDLRFNQDWIRQGQVVKTK